MNTVGAGRARDPGTAIYMLRLIIAGMARSYNKHCALPQASKQLIHVISRTSLNNFHFSPDRVMRRQIESFTVPAHRVSP